MQQKKDDINPWGIENVPFERYYVEFVDKLIEIAKKHGSKDYVETSYDWKTIEFIYRGFRIFFPKTAEDFEKHMNDVRVNSNKTGSAKGEGGAEVQLQMELPLPLYQMIKSIFQKQVWDKQFIKEFAKHFPQFKGGEGDL